MVYLMKDEDAKQSNSNFDFREGSGHYNGLNISATAKL